VLKPEFIFIPQNPNSSLFLPFPFSYYIKHIHTLLYSFAKHDIEYNKEYMNRLWSYYHALYNSY